MYKLRIKARKNSVPRYRNLVRLTRSVPFLFPHRIMPSRFNFLISRVRRRAGEILLFRARPASGAGNSSLVIVPLTVAGLLERSVLGQPSASDAADSSPAIVRPYSSERSATTSYWIWVPRLGQICKANRGGDKLLALWVVSSKFSTS